MGISGVGSARTNAVGDTLAGFTSGSGELRSAEYQLRTLILGRYLSETAGGAAYAGSE